MENTKQNLEKKTIFNDLCGLAVVTSIYLSTAGYVCCCVQQGSISNANKYLAEQFRDGCRQLNDAPVYALNP